MKAICIIFLLIFSSLSVWSQDITNDRWVDSGDQTVIDVPATNAGRVVVSKGFPQPGLIGFNELLRLNVNHSSTEYLSFRNGASGSDFVPAMFAYNANYLGSALMMIGVTNPDNDVPGTAPILNFNARRYNDNTLTTGGGAILSRPLFAWTNFTTVHMLMRANGNLGLGTTFPQAQLHTTGSVRFGGLPTGVGTSVLMADSDGNLTRSTLPSNTTLSVLATPIVDNTLPKVNENGLLVNSQLTDNGTGIGVGGPAINSAKLTLYGTMSLMSDARAKTNIVRMTSALQKVNALNGYYYDWKGQSAGREVGFLAQEVEQVLPEAVSENEQGTKFLNYDGVLPLLTEAIKEQQKLIQSQSALIEQLRKEVDALKRKR